MNAVAAAADTTAHLDPSKARANAAGNDGEFSPDCDATVMYASRLKASRIPLLARVRTPAPMECDTVVVRDCDYLPFTCVVVAGNAPK
jgi:hypothetical protein